MKKNTIYLSICLILFFIFGANAQDATNYAFSTTTSGSLTAGGGWTTLIGTGLNHTNFNDGAGNVPASAVVNIPFEVWFMGERFTSFNVNTNGVLRFGSTPIFSEGNTYNIPDHARLCPFSASSTTGGTLDEGDWQTGEIRYKIIGTAPQRTLIVQCNNMRVSHNSGSADASFEMRIQETSRPTVDISSGQMTFVYGRMTKGTSGTITAGNIGIGYVDGVGNDFLSVNISNHTVSTTEISNTYPSGVITALNSNSNGSRRTYVFNPEEVIGQEIDVTANCIGNTSFVLDWTDNASNEVGIVLYSSTDGVNYTFDRQLPANTTSATITGLAPNTTYYYRVYAVTEGKLSDLAVSGTVSFTTVPNTFSTVYSATSGNWNTASTWITNAVPTLDDNVIIGCINPHTVPVNIPISANECRTLQIEPSSILNFNSGQTLTVYGDVTNRGTINLDGGTLIIQGNLINDTDAVINVGNGTLIVEGDFQNYNTAVLNGNTGLFRLEGNFTNQGAYNPNTSTIRFDGNSLQLINHTGSSSYILPPTVTFPTSASLPLSIPPVGSGGGGGFGTSTNTDISDLNGYNSNYVRVVNFDVPAGNYTGINNLFIDLDHSYNDDIEIYLASPDGTVFTVAADMGSFGQDYQNVTFTMSAATTPPNGYADPITGSFRPIEDWSGYAGTYVGTWSLYIIDDDFLLTGQLNSTSLTLNQDNTPPPTGLQFYDLVMLNTGAGVRTQNTDIVINNSATWTNGVFRADNDHLIIFPDNATSTISTNESHADMWVRKIGNDAFDFPVGNDGWGAPIGISAPANTTDHFTANYIHQVTPYDPFSKEVTIHHVGQCEYWNLDRTNGLSNVVVTLSYEDTRSCTVGEENDLKVVRWDGSIWRDHFNGGLINTPYDGVLSAGTVNEFSPFTLGADDEFTILPITFTSFKVSPFEEDAILNWTTTKGKNHSRFEVECSINEKDFKVIGQVHESISASEAKASYSFIDKGIGLKSNQAYYRLKQIDKDGSFSYSNIQKVNWNINNVENNSVFVAYPNPFTDILTLDFTLDKEEIVEITLLDMTGRSIKTISQSFSDKSHRVEMRGLSNLKSGSYMVRLSTSTLQRTYKVVKM